jgi:hypothetical protein
MNDPKSLTGGQGQAGTFGVPTRHGTVRGVQ